MCGSGKNILPIYIRANFKGCYSLFFTKFSNPVFLFAELLNYSDIAGRKRLRMNEEDLQKLLEGDQEMFHRYFKQQYPKMFLFCNDFFHDELLAKDIVQDTFVSLWEKLTTIRDAVAIPAYSFRILKNRCLREIRMRAILGRFEQMDTLSLNEAELAHYDVDSDVLGSLFSEDLDQAYKRAIARLPERCRQVFLLSREKNMPYKDIARDLGISRRTVENEVYRGLKKIKLYLKEFMPTIIVVTLLFLG